MSLIRHFIATNPDEPIRAPMYEFALAANGVFLRAQRSGLRVQFPVMAGQPLRGLPALEPGIDLQVPRVPVGLVTTMLLRSAAACLPQPKEILFHLWYADRWRLAIPPQRQSANSVLLLDDSPTSSHTKALIQIHSHHVHAIGASFSSTDDVEERGFRIYEVLGHIFSRPQIRLRVGVYGYHYDIPAETILEMPFILSDVVSDE